MRRSVKYLMSEVQRRAPGGSNWVHSKTQYTYKIVGYCMIESTWSVGILYVRVGHNDPNQSFAICRDAEEFLDGRFRQEDG